MLELRAALRSLLKTPGVSFAALVNLTLGIAAVTFTFSVTYGAVFSGLPVPEGERIYRVFRTQPARGVDRMSVPLHDYVDWREEQSSFEALAAAQTVRINVTTAEDPVRLHGALVTPNTFSALRTRPFLGREFREAEGVGADRSAAILGYTAWRDFFDSDPDILGREIRVDGEAKTVVGVMPEGFRFPEKQDLWLPLPLSPLPTERGEGAGLMVYGRLADGVSPEAALTELRGIAGRLAEAYPEANEGYGVTVVQYARAFMGPGGDASMLLFLAIVFLVLFVACANVANLLLVRAAGRTREVAIRAALGARRRQILGRLLMEACALAVIGAVLGTGLAWLGLAIFNPYARATEPPYWFVFELNTPVLLFVVGTAVLVTLLSGVLPGLRVAGTKAGEALKDQGRGSSSLKIGRLTRTLVVAELALSLSLLVIAGLSIRSIVALARMELPFSTAEVLTGVLSLPEKDFSTATERDAFRGEVLRRVRARPGVSAAAMTTQLPGLMAGRAEVEIIGDAAQRPEDSPRVSRVAVSPGFFRTFDVDLLEGRTFAETDDSSSPPVAIVNRSFADRVLRNPDPVGMQFREKIGGSFGEWITVVGVSPDLEMDGLQSPFPEPSGYYRPLSQTGSLDAYLAVRARSNPLLLTPEVRGAVRAVRPDLPLLEVSTARDAVIRSMWHVTLFGTVFLVFGAVALFMACVGLYGVMAFATRQRTQEVGIRMALGARRGHVVRLVFRQGMTQLGLGLALGLLLAMGMGLATRSWYYGVSSTDPVVTALVAAVLFLTGMAALLIPARRATGVDPVRALRCD